MQVKPYFPANTTARLQGIEHSLYDDSDYTWSIDDLVARFKITHFQIAILVRNRVDYRKQVGFGGHNSRRWRYSKTFYNFLKDNYQLNECWR